MTTYSPQMDAALSAGAVTLFHAVEIMLPSGPLRVLDGSYQLTLAGQVFTGADPVYGVLAHIDGLDDGADAQISELTLTFNPPSAASAVVLASPAAQGSAVSVWKGAIDTATGLVIPSPKLLFFGTVDVPTLQGDQGSLTLTYSVTAETDRLFDADEGVRLSDSFMQTMWPGDMGCGFVTAVQDQMPWGGEPRVPGSVTAITSPIFPTFDFVDR